MSPEPAVAPVLHPPTSSHRGVLAWRWPEPRQILSSAPVGGGQVCASWLTNIGVALSYRRTDLDVHAQEVAESLGFSGDGVALLTAADVSFFQRCEVSGFVADATVGISKPTWAADPTGGWSDWLPGTVNVIVQVPRSLTHAAAVNAVITATEAKTQAFVEAGIPGSGTASDALAITWPSLQRGEEPATFAGPRSEVGTKIAQSVHGAVAAGIDDWVQRCLD